MPKRKTLSDRVFDLAYEPSSAEESQRNIDTLKAIHARRFGKQERVAKKVRQAQTPKPGTEPVTMPAKV